MRSLPLKITKCLTRLDLVVDVVDHLPISRSRSRSPRRCKRAAPPHSVTRTVVDVDDPLPVPAGSGCSRSPWNPSSTTACCWWWWRISAGLRQAAAGVGGGEGRLGLGAQGGLRPALAPLYKGRGAGGLPWPPLYPLGPAHKGGGGKLPPKFP